jgi:hypothetical protein
MRDIITILLLLIPAALFANTENNGRGARAVALANAFVAVSDDPWVVSYNPAGLAGAKSFAASLFIVPEQFGLSELRTFSAAAVLANPLVNVGAALDHAGVSLFRETSLTIACGREVAQGVALGIAATVTRVSFERYGSTTVLSIDLGASISLLEDLRLAYCWKNVTAASLAASADNLPQIQSMGIWYQVGRESQVTFDVEKDIRFPFVVKGGYEHWFFDSVALRFGCSNNPDKFSCGIGVLLSHWEFSYALYTHAQLGVTHQLGLSLRFPR